MNTKQSSVEPHVNTFIERYKVLNSSFDTVFVFQLGTGRGFCAEMIHLLKMSLKCLAGGIQLKLGEVRKPKGFSVRHGWNDYFLPVFDTHKGPYLDLLNRPSMPFGSRPELRYIVRSALIMMYGNNIYMTNAIGGRIDTDLVGSRLGLEGTYWEVIRQFVSDVWRYRGDVHDRINAMMADLRFPSQYVGVHIRRGDKITEAPYSDLEKYAELLCNKGWTHLPIYLATDDTSMLVKLKEVLGANCDVFSCGMNEGGYFQSKFNEMSKDKRWNETVFFLFELEMLKHANYFVGASPSNVFYWMRYCRGNREVHDVEV